MKACLRGAVDRRRSATGQCSLRDRDEGVTIGVYFAHPGKAPGVEDRRENR